MSVLRGLVVSSLAAVAVANGLYVHSNELAAHFAKRQQMPEPGTPAYNCHDNCGQSIIASRGADPCHDKTFLTDYAVCLSCAGPDNYGIWKYYGGALAKAANSCGLSTTPGTEKTTDVPLAISAKGSAATSSAPPPPLTTGQVTSAAPSSTTAEPSATSSSSGSAVSGAVASASSSAAAQGGGASPSTTGNDSKVPSDKHAEPGGAY